MDASKVKFFNGKIATWGKQNYRPFPWRKTRNLYRLLVAEILLQQTDAPKVVPVYRQLFKRYTTPNELALARIVELRKIVMPLGLIKRSRLLSQLGRTLAGSKRNKLTLRTKTGLMQLPGIGDYSGAAAACFGLGCREAILDTNIIRLFDRFFGIRSDKNRPRTDKKLWDFAQSILPQRNFREYNYAMLDFSAKICTFRSPKCTICPLKKECIYAGTNGLN